jgi:hypothetical protein
MYDRLQQAFPGQPLFKDVDTIPGGVDYRRSIVDAIASSQAFLLIIGPDWMGRRPDGSYRIADPSDWCRAEVEAALVRGIPVLPVLVRGATMPDIGAVVPALADVAYQNARVVRADPDFRVDMERVIRDLERVARLRPADPTSSNPTDRASAPRAKGYYADPLTADRPFEGWSRPVQGYVYRWRPYLSGLIMVLGGLALNLVLIGYASQNSAGAQTGAFIAVFLLTMAEWIAGFIVVVVNRRKIPRAWR